MKGKIVWHDAGSVFDNAGDGFVIDSDDMVRAVIELGEAHEGVAAVRSATVDTTACTEPDTFTTILFGDGSVAVYRTNHFGGQCD
jgi:hypothetical protein